MERFTEIAESWFLSEPALFVVYCSHKMCENTTMKVPLRTGKGCVEYNPALIEGMSQRELRQRLAVEMVRIMLKHPYERQPIGSKLAALHIGSDMVVSQHYPVVASLGYAGPALFDLPDGQTFEWYVDQLNNLPSIESDMVSPMVDESLGLIDDGGGAEEDDATTPATNSGDSEQDDGESGGNDDEKDNSESGSGDDEQDDEKNGNREEDDGGGGDDDSNGTESASTCPDDVFPSDDFMRKAAEQAELWEEDDERKQSINDVIQNIKDWGSLPGKLVETVVASTQGRIDYRRVMRGFCTSVLSSHRRLTRMRPNRRSGFDYMGSTYDLQTRLLVAVDVSGSVPSKTISHFLAVIQRFFKHGVSEVDVIQFDAKVKDSVVKLKEARQHFDGGGFKVMGRGGTCFQPIFDYLKQHNDYDGLVILTDGYAPVPKIDFRTRAKILWVCQNQANYEDSKEWMKQIGRACYMET